VRDFSAATLTVVIEPSHRTHHTTAVLRYWVVTPTQNGGLPRRWLGFKLQGLTGR